MTDTWHSILERAAENLSVELSDRPIPVPSPSPNSLRHFQRRASRPLTFAETRELLARELEAIPASEREAPAAKILQRVGRQKRQAKPRAILPDPAPLLDAARPPLPPVKKSGAGRGLIALALSVSAVTLTLYGIYVFVH